jgi:hypothetical protein
VGEIFTSKRIAIAPLIPPGNRVYTGAALNIHGIRFLLVMAPPGSDRAGTLLDKATYRPAFFQFVADGRPPSSFPWLGYSTSRWRVARSIEPLSVVHRRDVVRTRAQLEAVIGWWSSKLDIADRDRQVVEERADRAEKLLDFYFQVFLTPP